MVARDRRPVLARARSWDAVARESLTGPASWRVHSVFRGAFNLVADCGLVAEYGGLVGVVAAPGRNGPATVVLAPDAGVADVAVLLAPGLPARRQGCRLVIGEALSIDLSGACLWSPPPIERTVSADELLGRAGRAASVASREAPAGGLAGLLADVGALAGRPSPSGECPHPPRRAGCPPPSTGPAGIAGSPRRERGSPHGCRGPLTPSGGVPDSLTNVARERIAGLVGAIRAGRPEEVLAAARSLSGLGPGLTPSGDDVLAGLALGLRAAGGGLPGWLGAAISEAVDGGRTTDLAAARVRHAVAGRADEAVYALLKAVVSGEDADLDGAVRALLECGHSSGADTLLGLLLGLSDLTPLSPTPRRKGG